MDDTAIYLRNAAAMWSSLGPSVSYEGPLFRAVFPGFTRLIALAPAGPVEPPDGAYTFEDAFGPPADGLERLPVMVRPPGPVDPVQPRPGVTVGEVRDAAELVVAERVMVDGFPLPRFQPLHPGRALPARVLSLPGWRVWLAYRDGEPAAGAYTFDDGTSTGVYWVVTLPGHRGQGLAGTLLSAAISPNQPHSLVATHAGRPLYEKLGFAVTGHVNWHSRD
ncbi:GNAT family N-acetyltransferase [Actinoplanes sp. LDG1-06]|uniref:GNAT family N-acetyltransferase n=1 Tax=Paractinoplanes ovalisporus TaxID=2810368 RepID=A0ABS2A9S3_9ACTN|nr:GNAT family N-acetyltransferase [Actinoplanes ovalisporus]MBM2616575.1 GNAT family N-acetyltransferase [Actinoplanes ovalisporus]